MKILKNFIAKCVCSGIELYAKKYRFVLNSSIEIIPLQHKDFEKHLMNVFQNNNDCVRAYLEKAPTTAPQEEQTTK